MTEDESDAIAKEFAATLKLGERSEVFVVCVDETDDAVVVDIVFTEADSAEWETKGFYVRRFTETKHE